MLYDQIGDLKEKSSKVILGTWQAGGTAWGGTDENEITQAIRKAVDIGIRSIDTAAEYGMGHSEQVIGKALKNVQREKYQIFTKVFANHLKYDDVLKECEKSLRNLSTDYVDLYQIHWPSGSWGSEVVPIEETMRALVKLKTDGKILNIGVSNFSKKQILEAKEYGPIVSNQPPYSLIWRSYDAETNPLCREQGLAILAYSPLAQGILTGKFKVDHHFAKNDTRAHSKFFDPKIFPKIEEVLAGLKPYAEKYKATIGNIALNWVLSQPRTFAIVGVRSPAQLEQSVKCADFQLSKEDLAALDTLSEKVTKNMKQDHMMWR